MKKLYQLRNKAARQSVDLRNFEDVIINSYAFHCPNVQVEVFPHYYLIDGDFTNAQVRKAGHDIAASDLGKYCLRYKCNDGTSIQLFWGEEME